MEQRSIEVGVLGATGVVGQHFVSRLARHPWFTPVWLAASERSEGKTYADAAPWRLAAPMPKDAATRIVHACVPANAPEDRLLGARRVGGRRDRRRLRRRRARRGQQRPQLPDGSAGAAADSRGQRRPPRRRGRAAEGQGLERGDRHQSQLLDHRARLGAGAAAPVRALAGGGQHHASGVGRRLSRACRRSTSSATSCRSSAARKRRCRARRRRFSAATVAGRRTRCGSAPTPTACR